MSARKNISFHSGKDIFQHLLFASILVVQPCLLYATEFEDELFGTDSVQKQESSSQSSPDSSAATVDETAFDESDFFGGESSSQTNPSSGSSFKSLMQDKLLESDDQFTIGGKYYHSMNFTGTDSQAAKDTAFSSDGIADIYFDAALDDGVRFFMRQKIQQDFSAADDSSNVVNFSGPEASTSIDQMWLKFDYRNKLYMTMGRQPTSWGAGFVWAPTDFINEQSASPFALSDQRLGVSLMKFQYPMDTEGMNIYGVLQTDQANTLGQIKSLVRIEKVFEDSELALSFSSEAHQELQGGIDYSTGLKWFDFYFNLGATKNDQGTYYERPPGSGPLTSDDLLGLLQAGIDNDPDAIPPNAQLLPVDRSDEILKQLSSGLIYIKGFDDSSQLVINAEYFYNEKGYEDSEFLTLLLLLDPASFDPLHFSRRYLATGFTRSGLGPSSQSYGLQYIRNISDTSGAVVATFGFKPYSDLNFSSNIIVFTGGAGTFNPFKSDQAALEETAERVANGELVIPDNLQNLPPVLVPQDTDPITATVGETSFEGPRYMLRMQLSLKF